MTTAEPRNVALQFATHKVPTFPVRVSRLGDRWLKRPHISEWATRATYSKAQITEWWHCWPNAMVGVPLARVGLVVVDADRHPGAADGVGARRGAITRSRSVS